MTERQPSESPAGSFRTGEPSALDEDGTVLRSTPLTADEIMEFANRGFLRPGRVFSDGQVERFRTAMARARERERAAGREYDLLDPSLWPDDDRPPPEPGKTVGFLFNLWLFDNDYREIAFSPTLARWAAQLIGARQVRVLEDNALYKEPGVGGTLQWHQDFPYWPLAQPNAITAWVALDDVDETNGAMHMAPGSHLTGETLPGIFGTGTAYMHDMRAPTVKPIQDPRELGWETDSIRLEKGAVSFHHALTWHASGPNMSDRPRRAAIVRYVADGTIWLGSRRYEYNYGDDEVGIGIGEPLGGYYFPIVPF
jgi:phytanoyl-CoA hydroxylase